MRSRRVERRDDVERWPAEVWGDILVTMPDDTEPATGLDCLTCGACCRTGHDGRILVPAEDLVRWRRIGREDLIARLQPGHFGEQAFATTADGACVHLGTALSPNACAIYEIRGTTCREFERGSWQCREFRRDHGIER
ncbi:MAG: YkgJ family cysteine cluster protein [Deltaproteobacteria bacterium]|nr:YkgJ family cysteine cluster protein [Deltaproteobacteria bacterium]